MVSKDHQIEMEFMSPKVKQIVFIPTVLMRKYKFCPAEILKMDVLARCTFKVFACLARAENRLLVFRILWHLKQLTKSLNAFLDESSSKGSRDTAIFQK